MTSPSTQSSWSQPAPFSDVDITILAIFILELVVDAILVGAAIKKLPNHVVPWLCINGVIMALLLVSHTLHPKT